MWTGPANSTFILGVQTFVPNRLVTATLAAPFLLHAHTHYIPMTSNVCTYVGAAGRTHVVTSSPEYTESKTPSGWSTAYRDRSFLHPELAPSEPPTTRVSVISAVPVWTRGVALAFVRSTVLVHVDFTYLRKNEAQERKGALLSQPFQERLEQFKLVVGRTRYGPQSLQEVFAHLRAAAVGLIRCSKMYCCNVGAHCRRSVWKHNDHWTTSQALTGSPVVIVPLSKS